MNNRADSSSFTYNNGRIAVTYYYAIKTYEFFRLEPFERLLKDADKETLLVTAEPLVDDKTFQQIQTMVNNRP